jgi:hypothetical protein
MTEHTIKVAGLPEGYKVIEAHVTSSIRGTNSNGTAQVFASITVEKIQPLRIVLEEISKEEYYRLFHDEQCTEIYNLQRSYWKQVNENEVPLTKDECNLKIKKLEAVDKLFNSLHKAIQNVIKDK